MCVRTWGWAGPWPKHTATFGPGRGHAPPRVSGRAAVGGGHGASLMGGGGVGVRLGRWALQQAGALGRRGVGGGVGAVPGRVGQRRLGF